MCLTPGLVQGQTLPTISYGSSAPEELNPQPLRYKGLVIKGDAELGTLYDTNVFSQNTNEESDVITFLKPQLSITKQYDGTIFNVYGNGMVEKFASNTSENREDYTVGFDIERNINSKWTVQAGALNLERHRNRRDPTGNAATKELTSIKNTEFSAGATRRFNRLTLRMLGKYNMVKNEDGVSRANPNQQVIFSDNDRNITSLGGALIYAIEPGNSFDAQPNKSIYVWSEVAQQDYKERGNTSGVLSRDRNTYNFLLGYISKFKSLSLTTNFAAGYLVQDFDEDSVDDTKKIDLYAQALYQPYRRLLLDLSAERDVTQDNDFLRGITKTSVVFNSLFELRHNLYLNGGFSYELSEFDGVNREDSDYTGKLNLEYRMNPHLAANVGVTHFMRNSTAPAEEFDKTIFLLSLTGSL